MESFFFTVYCNSGLLCDELSFIFAAIFTVPAKQISYGKILKQFLVC